MAQHYDPLIFDPEPASALTTPEEWRNYIEERFGAVVEQVRADPGPQTAIINGRLYKTWERMLMITYGRCVESVVQSWLHKKVTAEEFQSYKRRLQFVMQGTAAEVQLGVRGR